MSADSGTARRSDGTRAAILAAARQRFSLDGYERATIRAIAAHAGIDPSMVMRYYGSKEKLFFLAAEFDLRLPDLAAAPRAQWGEILARHMVVLWDGDETLMALLRAAVTNEAVAEKARTIFAAQLAPLVRGGYDQEAIGAKRAGLVATQALGFALCRYILRFPPVVALTADEVAQWLGPTIQRYLEPEAA
jgi:AcrR family transcriptional regulator